MPGLLYVVATPIGNLEDITYRAVRVLGEADLIACEDTRQTRKLLDHYGIKKPAVSYHEHNEMERTAELTARMLAGAVIALVSDAGMPLVSDPGYRLVKSAVDNSIPVQPIPGASAALAALTREMAADFGVFGIRVNAIAPGEIDTAMLSPGTEKIVEHIPMHRLGTPDEVAKIIYVLCTETASYVNGAEIHINGGQHV